MPPIDILRLRAFLFLLSRYTLQHEETIYKLSFVCRSNYSTLTVNSCLSLQVQHSYFSNNSSFNALAIIPRILTLLAQKCSSPSVYLDTDLLNIRDFSCWSNPPFPIDHTSPFFIGRLGCRGAETVSSYLRHSNQFHLLFEPNSPYNKYLNMLKTNCGIFPLSHDSLLEYTTLYLHAITNASHIRSFPLAFLPEIYLSSIAKSFSFSGHHWDSRDWIYHFSDKRILIVSPFVDDIKFQIERSALPNALGVDDLFDSCSFSYVKVPITNGLVVPNDLSWRDVYRSVCDDISKHSDFFDLALVSAGGYGMPICNFTFSTLKRSTIYVGGNLQCWFGLLGNRWRNVEAWSSLWNDFWISPSTRPPGSSIIDGNCYWT